MFRPTYDLVPLEHKPPDDFSPLTQAEREWFAGLLHDNLAQDLAFISSQAAAIRILLTKGKNERALEQVELLEEVSQNLSGDIRSLIGQLNQSEMVPGCLKLALKELIESFSNRCKILVHYEVPSHQPGAHLNQQTRLEVYYIVKEALANICKHAAAKTVWVHLAESETCMDVVVRDNGRGFQAKMDGSLYRNHFGLSIMQTRATRIGARLKIENQASQGTQLTVCIPHKSKGKS